MILQKILKFYKKCYDFYREYYYFTENIVILQEIYKILILRIFDAPFYMPRFKDFLSLGKIKEYIRDLFGIKGG